MKKQSLFLAFCTLLSSICLAQSGTNYDPVTGNVGIGTTTPQTTLDIQKNAARGQMVSLSISDNENQQIATQSKVLIGALKSNDAVGIPTYSIPGIWFGSDAVSPTYNNITFANDASQGPVFNAVFSKILQFRTDGYTKMAIGSGGVGIGIGHNVAPSYPFHVRTAGDFVVNANGQVGIGTTNPQGNLHLQGDNPWLVVEGTNSYYPKIKMKSLGGEGFLDNYNVTNALSGGINMQASSPNGRVSLGVVPARGIVSISENPTLVTHNVIGAIGQTADLFQVSKFIGSNIGDFRTQTVLNVTPTGRVGIGTATPQAELAVNGDIYAKKLKITLAGWADYVFHPSYKLPSLKEVEEFIKRHQHLPGVPSAKDVEKNDLDVGENQAVLLKKIEELTLYMIDLKKQVDKQQNTIRALKKQLKNR